MKELYLISHPCYNYIIAPHYLAFPFAEKYKQVEVVGLDIAEKTLEENQRKYS